MAQRERAQREAESLLVKAGIDEAPVPVERLARDHGVEVVYELHQGGTSGLLIHEPDGRKVINVNTFHAATRQRFTVAHELGHAILHLRKPPASVPDVMIDKPREILFRDGRSAAAIDSKEIEANAFAAELLMPARLVKASFTRELDGTPTRPIEDVVDRLASEFEVSRQAMSYRLVNLDLIDPV